MTSENWPLWPQPHLCGSYFLQLEFLHLEELFVASQEADRPVLPHGHHIAGVQPALSVDHCRGLLRFLVITLHQGVAPYTQFPP
jgi:hypothetical protein